MDTCVYKILRFAPAPPGHRPLSSVWWCDAALRRCDVNPLTGRLPLGRRADGAPSHRITKPTSRLARERQEIEPGSSTLVPRTVPDAPRECGVPTPPRSPFRRLSSLALARAWPFAVARATRVCRRNHNQTGTVWRVIALARSDHPIATGESEPSMTVPRTSPPAIVWCCETPVLENLDERSERDKRELGQGPTWSIQHQRAHQSRVRTLAAGPRSAWGRTMPDRESVVWSRIVTIRHATSFW